jgi:hypothetical protein
MRTGFIIFCPCLVLSSSPGQKLGQVLLFFVLVLPPKIQDRRTRTRQVLPTPDCTVQLICLKNLHTIFLQVISHQLFQMKFFHDSYLFLWSL